MSSQPESKRRRVSSDNTVQPALVLSSSPTFGAGKEDISELKQIPKLLLELPKDNFNHVQNALKRLRSLFKESDSPQGWAENRKEAIDVGMVGMLVFLLRKMISEPGVEGILANTMGCLGYLATDDALPIVKLGGLDLIVTILKGLPLDLNVQANGLFAVTNILSFERRAPLPIQEETEKFVTKMQGINLIVTAMKGFPDSKILQQNGCRVFSRISKVTAHHEALHKSGATAVAATAVGHHLDDAGIKKDASYFFSKMFHK